MKVFVRLIPRREHVATWCVSESLQVSEKEVPTESQVGRERVQI